MEIFIEVRDMDQNNIDEFFKNIKNYVEEENIECEIIKTIEKPSVSLDKK